MFQKFKALSALKKTLIVLGVLVMFFFVAPITVKVASAGEIDLFAMVQQLLFRVDQQEAKISELEGRVGLLEAGQEPEEPEELGEEPEPEPEPEPWPALARVDYKLTPQHSDWGQMEYRFEGTNFCLTTETTGLSLYIRTVLPSRRLRVFP